MVKTSDCGLAIQKIAQVRICLISREEICTYSVKEILSCYHLNTMLLRTLIRMHFITPCHIIHVIIYASMISYFILMHIGSFEGITLLEFNEEDKGDQQETPQAAALREEEQTPKELLECLDHRPTSFLKGKPRSILSLPLFQKILLESFMFDALGYKS